MVNRSQKKYQRLEGNRETKPVSSSLLCFSFKSLDVTQPKDNPQTLALWAEKGLLEKFVNHLKELSAIPVADALSTQRLKLYGKFPDSSKSDFIIPKHLEKADYSWGVIKTGAGQTPRVAGYLIENIFHVVFLDIDHKFYKSKKKHT